MEGCLWAASIFFMVVVSGDGGGDGDGGRGGGADIKFDAFIRARPLVIKLISLCAPSRQI